WQVLDGRGRGVLAWSEKRPLAAGEAVTQSLNITLAGAPDPGIYTLLYRLEDSTRAVEAQPPFGPDRTWVVQPEGAAGQFVTENWPEDVANAPQIGLGLTVDSEYVLDGSSIPIHLSLRNFGTELFAGTVRLSTWARQFPDVAVEAAPGAFSTYDLRVGPVHLTTGHDGLPGGGAVTAELYSASGDGPLAKAVKNLLNNPKLFEISLEASDQTAGAGDEVHFFGTISNRSLGEFSIRYRMTFTNYYNTASVHCPETKTDWRDRVLGPDQSFSLDEPYTVPTGCNGIINATLHLCDPGQLCWVDGFEGNATHRSVQVGLPNANVELGFGEFEVVDGPAFRLPVRVRNIGKRDVEQGQLRLWTHLSSIEVESATFDLPRGAETTITVDFPIPPPNPFRRYYTIGAAFRDRTVTAWSFHTTHDLYYGGGISSIEGFNADPGSEAITGGVQIENRSSATRHFVLSFDQPDLDFHETRELDIGSFQRVTVTLSVPLPSPSTYGTWPLRVAATDGALLNLQRTINLVHYRPFMGFAVRSDAASCRSGETANLTIEVSPGRLARPLAATLELACDRLQLLETRTLMLTSLQTAAESFTLQVPPDSPAGTIAYRVRLSASDGTVVQGEGSLTVPPAKFEVRSLQAQAVTAGDTITYEVRNVGGSSAGSFAFEWQLWGERGWLANSARTIPAPLDQQQQITFTIPADIVTGSYWASLQYYSGGERTWHTEKLEIAGVESTLDVGTGSPVYAYGQVIDGWAKVTNGPQPFPNASLTLKVLAPKLCTARIAPWGFFQGSGSREGAARVGGAVFPPGFPQPCFEPMASLPAGVSPIALATGDVNEDGTDDVVAVSRGTSGLSLGIFAGPNLAQSGSIPLPGAASAAAVSVGDSDGDGHLEIFEADLGEGSPFAVRALDRALRPLWETSVPIATEPVAAFPAGGLVLADLEGDGQQSDLLVSSGRDVLALDASVGTVRWRMLEVNPSLSGRIVTGFAAADAEGDGRPEVAVGFRVPGTPASGGVTLLDASGTARWSVATTYAIAGSPVIGSTGRIALIQTPEGSATSSILTLLDAATGNAVSQTTTPFWSQWPPASADTNGDGASEYAVVSGDPSCETCAPRVVSLFSSQGSLLWSLELSGQPTAAPVLVDMTGDGLPDVVVNYFRQPNRNDVECARGTDGARIADWFFVPGASPNALPLYVLDVNGDCLPEILGGRDVFRGRSCATPHRIATTMSAQAQGEVVWRWEGSNSLAAEQVWDVPKELSTNQSTGFFYLVGDLKNSLGQLVAHDESTFSVQWGIVLLSLDPFPQACRAGGELQAKGTIRNTGTVARTFDLVFLLDKVEFARRTITLAAGESKPFSETFQSGGTGTHTLAINAMAGTSGLQYVTQQFRVEEPAAKVSVPELLKVGQEEFELKAEVANSTHLPLELEVGLDLPDQPPTERQHVTLAAESKATLVFPRQVSADTTFVVRVSGDAAVEEPCFVDYDVELEPIYAGPAGLPAGDAVLHFQLANGGGHPWHGELLWSLAGATNASGSVAWEVAAASTQNLDVPVTVAPGASLLRLEAGGMVREFPVAASTGGHGSLSVAVPSQVIEGEVAIAVQVANLLPTTGSFQVDLEIRDDETGDEVATEHLVLNLDGDQSAEESVPLNLAAAPYLLIPRLNGIVVGEGPQRFEVLPRYAAEMTAAVGPAQGDGTLPLVVTMRNSGARDLSGTLTINGLGQAIVTPDFGAAVGETTQITLPIEPDLLPAGEVSIEAIFTTGTGQVLAEHRVVIPVLPAAPVLASVPQSVGANAGGLAPVEFVVANAGTQTALYELSLSVNGGSVFTSQQEGRLRGGQQEPVRFEVPLPGDMPSSRLDAVYALVRIDETSDEGSTVATGRFGLTVQGAQVRVTAVVDRDNVQAGGTIVLTLTLEADPLSSPLPLFALVSYPPFEERREFELGGGTRLSFEIPIEQPGGELGYGIYFPSGRALYLDALTIHPAGGPVEISALQREYRPGEQVQLAVTLNQPGVFEAYGFEHDASLSASGGATFPIPDGLPQGRYPILWTFYGSGPDVGVVNGEYPVKVRGPLVRITRLKAARPDDLSSLEGSVQALVTTDTSLATTLRAWLAGPSGQATFMGEMPLDLQPGELHEGGILLDLSGAEAGAQSCVVGVYGQDDTLLAEAAAQLDLGGGRVLGVRTDKAFCAGAGDAVTALVDAQGSGPGSLALRLDGVVAIARSVSLSGVQRIAVLVPGPSAGRHNLEAVLEADGRTSSALTSFSVGTSLPDLAVDLGGAQTESGLVSIIAHIRNVGLGDAPGTDLALWDGEPDAGTLVTVLAVDALAAGAEAFVPAEITLAEGTHTVAGWLDRAAAIEEFDRSNNVARFDITVGPGAQPPSTYTVQAASSSYRLGDPIV
ncbi:MAG TPA: FG-GAP-like repeat-containing protein, partial [Thermoanaerobaculaceae bacterium]|nr:FG-GAP-like repeat-containing protein [Thermoanaerobaculaceae bacterium]